MLSISTRPTGSDAAPAQDADPWLPAFVGESPAIGSIKDIAASIAPRRSTVLISGETGTGKEMLARHIHALSDRADKPFVPVDCSALTDSLFESQLFGHVRGAFTGAVRDSIGFIRAADTGTLFLDEVGELPTALQAKLLRVIQERAVCPVGDTNAYPVDIRIVCASNRDLVAMVRLGQFREDLYFRLNVISLNVPPLRERPQDVLPLVRHFLKQQASVYGESTKHLAQDARDAMQNYAWPGNVRELANVVEHAHVLADGMEITVTDLPEQIRSREPQPVGSELRLDDVERRTIAEALRRTKGNKAAAARLLGLNIQRLGRKLEKLNIAAD